MATTSCLDSLGGTDHSRQHGIDGGCLRLFLARCGPATLPRLLHRTRRCCLPPRTSATSCAPSAKAPPLPPPPGSAASASPSSTFGSCASTLEAAACANTRTSGVSGPACSFSTPGTAAPRQRERCRGYRPPSCRSVLGKLQRRFHTAVVLVSITGATGSSRAPDRRFSGRRNSKHGAT